MLDGIGRFGSVTLAVYAGCAVMLGRSCCGSPHVPGAAPAQAAITRGTHACIMSLPFTVPMMLDVLCHDLPMIVTMTPFPAADE